MFAPSVKQARRSAVADDVAMTMIGRNLDDMYVTPRQRQEPAFAPNAPPNQPADVSDDDDFDDDMMTRCARRRVRPAGQRL